MRIDHVESVTIEVEDSSNLETFKLHLIQGTVTVDWTRLCAMSSKLISIELNNVNYLSYFE